MRGIWLPAATEAGAGFGKKSVEQNVRLWQRAGGRAGATRENSGELVRMVHGDCVSNHGKYLRAVR